MPYGYRIENGTAVVCKEQAAQIRKVYEGYLGGLSLRGAAREAGLTLSYASVKRMMQNLHYLGDEFYPAIIDRETYDAAEEERLKRVESWGKKCGKKPVVAVKMILKHPPVYGCGDAFHGGHGDIQLYLKILHEASA